MPASPAGAFTCRCKARWNRSSRPWRTPACSSWSAASPPSRNCSWPTTARKTPRPETTDMAGLATRAPAQPARATGRSPGLQVGIQAGRKATRSGLLWGLVFGLYVMVQTLAYTSAYKTQAARQALESAYGGNLGLNALIGPARAIDTVAGYAAWRLLGVLSVLGAIWGLLTATRLLRGEEDTGRLELLLAGPTTRSRAAVQSVAGL